MSSAAGRRNLAALPAPDSFPGRLAYARAVCEAFEFRDPRGRLQETGCPRAPGGLDGVVLPPPGAGSDVSRFAAPVASAVGVPDRVDRVSDLFVQVVDDPGSARLFNERLIGEHPEGATVPVGRQLRYLTGSDHGWLGGYLFAASALALKPRGRWIGWDSAGREAHLDRVIGLSRFLVRSGLACRNLASRILGLCLGRVAGV